MIKTVVTLELYKIFKKWRTYIGFIAIGVLVPIIHIALLIDGNQYLNFITQNLQQNFIFVGNLLNGYLTAYIVLGGLWVHIPFLITLVAGDLLAGEATAGTYRVLITRPVSRFKLVTSKFLAGVIYTQSLVLWLAIMSLGLGVLLFGAGELIVVKAGITIFAKDDVLWRFLLGYGFAALSMTTVTSIAFFFSSLVENAIGPIITTMAIIIVFIIISAIDISVFQAIKPYLFTNYLGSWRLFFDDVIDYAKIFDSIWILFLHIAAFYGLTLYLFKRKDILT